MAYKGTGREHETANATMLDRRRARGRMRAYAERRARTAAPAGTRRRVERWRLERFVLSLEKEFIEADSAIKESELLKGRGEAQVRE
jgi:hypothetical protein